MTSLLDRFKHRRLQSRLAGPKLLAAFADATSGAFFVEIGANDGRSFDHLAPFIRTRGWRGIMVEPVPHVFAQLQANYGDVEGVVLENAAVADRDGALPFHHLREEVGEARAALPPFYDALGSFELTALLAHEPQIPDLRERLVTVDVPALTFSSLLVKHDVAAVDLVLIDTEGYDHELLRAIDLDRHRPRVVVYEHFHMDPEQRASTRALMASSGYGTMEEGFDTFCLRDASADDAVARRWRGLRPAIPGVTKADE